MSQEQAKVNQAFGCIVELAMALGVRDIKALTGCWQYQLDSHWRFAVNGHGTAQRVEPPECMAVNLEPYSAAVWRNGWLALLIDPFGGVAMGNTENEFIGAMNDALVRVGAKP